MHKLSNQIMLIYGVLVILTFSISGWMVNNLAQQIVMRNLSLSDHDLVARVAGEINVKLTDVRSLVTLLAESASLQSMDAENIQLELENHQNHFPSISEFLVFDQDGELIAFTSDISPKDEYIFGTYVASSGYDLVSGVYLPPGAVAPIFTIYTPIINDNVVVGVLIADINFAYVQTLLEGLDLSLDQTAVVFAENGRVIAHSRMEELARAASLEQETIKLLTSRVESEIVASYQDELGRTVIGAYAEIPNTGWGVAIQTPLADINAELAGVSKILFRGFWGSMALIFLLGYWLSKQLTSPINELVLVTQQVAAGDLSAAVEVHAVNELGQLSRAFNQMVEDIQLAQLDLKESEARLTQAQEVAHIGSWDWDIVNNIVNWSDEFYRIFGCEVKGMEATYQGFLAAIYPEDQEKVNTAVENTLEHYKPYGVDHRVLMPDGAIHIIHEQGEVIRDEAGQAIRMVGTAQDVTERRQAETEIRRLNAELEKRVALRTVQLEQANKELEAFSYSVSHDLRAPLRAVRGFAEILKTELGETITEKSEIYLNQVLSSTKKMGELIEGLLKLSRLGQREMHYAPLNISGLVREVFDELTLDIGDRQLELILENDCRISGDFHLIEIMLRNLLNNAIKFTRDRDRGVIEFGCLREEGQVVYFLRDNGVGFDTRFSEKMFQPFQRLHSITEYEGTGIGLSIVLRVMQRHAGRIWVDSALGDGTTFYMAFYENISEPTQKLPLAE